MPVIAPCRACLPPDCAGLSSEPDIYSIYSLEQPPFSFVFNCPPGFDCNSAPFLLMNCCGQTVFQNLIGVVEPQRSQLINAAVGRCVQAWQFCGELGDGRIPIIGGGGGGGAPPTLNLFYSGRACCQINCFGGATSLYCMPAGSVLDLGSFNRAQALANALACSRGNEGRHPVGNSRQCFTASCPPGNPTPPVTRCVEANTYGECLFSPDDAQIAAALQFYNDIAQTEAHDTAQAALACLVCNATLTGSLFCGGNPGLVVSGTIPTGRVCGPPGTSQLSVDAQAHALLYADLAPRLASIGCNCQVTNVDYVVGNFTTNCTLQFMLLYGNIFQAFININGAAPALCSPALSGNVVRWLPFSFAGPEIQFYCP